MLNEVDLELAREYEDIIIDSYKYLTRKIRDERVPAEGKLTSGYFLPATEAQLKGTPRDKQLILAKLREIISSFPSRGTTL